VKLATIRTEGGTAAAIIEGDSAIEIPGLEDVGEVLRTIGLDAVPDAATGARRALEDVDFAPLVLAPSKIVCVGLNYRAHILEMKRDMPEHPTLFAKFADSLLGANDDLVLPPEVEDPDWEGELVVVIGRNARRARGAEAEAAIAGYSVGNDVSMRDWQYRTTQWLQGKMWADTTPVGPVLATPDELPFHARITTEIDGDVKQDGEIHDLVHGPARLVEYISTITRLRPGDLILTGTPGGVGHARDPRERLRPGTTVTVTIEGIGSLRNRVVAEAR